MLINRRQTALALAAAALPWGMAHAQAKTPDAIPVADFFRRQQMNGAALNPAGTHIALRIGGGGDLGRRRLVVLELATMKTTPVAALKDADVSTFRWVNDQRLVFQVADEEQGWGTHGLFGVDADGSDYRQLAATGWKNLNLDSRLLGGGVHLMQDFHAARGDEVLVVESQDHTEGFGFLKLIRVNTRTGISSEVTVPPRSWGFLIGTDGEPQVAMTTRDDKRHVMWRDGAQWVNILTADRYFGDAVDFETIAPDGTVYVSTRRGRDQTALYTFDPKAKALSDKPVLALAQFDIEFPDFQVRAGKVLGVRVNADAVTTVWWDADAKALQAKIDAKLTTTTNQLTLPRHGNSPWVLVNAFGDRFPSIYLAYNRETDKLVPLGREHPQLDPKLLSGMDFTPYKARDGRTIPAYLTLPRSAGAKRPLPLIVYVHGGPWVRGGHWSFNPEVQFLASRGYAVLQPDFRGSTGYGQSHLEAGWRQWGRAMQDDLADGAKWAIAQGHADPKRIAILGASYGGYAAMMGLVNDPDVYCCAVNWVGVTDLDLMFSAYWSDVPAVAKRLGLPKVIGDPKADAEMLKAQSPVHQAHRIQKPVLMAYGRLDQRVPIQHGERMRDALRGHNQQVEWVVYPEEGHGWGKLATQVDFWTRVEKFLARHMA
jgi:dipeptidyl aminopeptidase/acylaminoacyl peptidase